MFTREAASDFVYWGHFIPFFSSDPSQVWSVPRVGARAWLSCPGWLCSLNSRRPLESGGVSRVRRCRGHTPLTAALQWAEKLWRVCVCHICWYWLLCLFNRWSFAQKKSCVCGGLPILDVFCIHIKLQNKSNLIPPIMVMWMSMQNRWMHTTAHNIAIVLSF